MIHDTIPIYKKAVLRFSSRITSCRRSSNGNISNISSISRPYYIYSIAAISLKDNEKEKLDSHHRSQLRRLLRIFYPKKISNERLYERTGTNPISIEITKARWSFLGHILRGADQKNTCLHHNGTIFSKKGIPN